MSVRCRGTCSNDHTTEVMADPGRVTWHGPCATEGCESKVYCRRVPADTPPPPPETRTAEPNPHRVLEVPGYRDEPPPADDADRPDLTDDDADRPSPSGGGGDPPAKPAERPARRRRPPTAPAPPVTPAPPHERPPAGALGRWRARLAAGDDVDGEDERLFGVY